MILAEKITENRKKNGWSQEDLAYKLGVSRQSVSKWESAQAVPDMKKILQLSELFGVSTDYLIKEEIEAPEPVLAAPVDDGIEESVRKVSMEEASAFLQHNDRSAHRISAGVTLCILSPVIMLLLEVLAMAGALPLSEEQAPELAGAIGVGILLIMVAAAVGIFLWEGMHGKPYEYLETDNIDTEYGVTGMVRERRDAYAETHSRRIVIGVMLCVISAVPMLIAGMTHYSDDSESLQLICLTILLLLCAVGVRLIVLTSCLQGGYDRLLEEGDYTRLNKRISRFDGIYWAIVTALYLAWSFVTRRWEFTWIVWPVAGVLYAAFREILKAVVTAKGR